MSNLVAFSQASLPAVSTLSTALRAIQSDVGPAGTAILKMDKTGHWGLRCRSDRSRRRQQMGDQPFLLCPRLYCLG
jgi:hypothetical protein